MAKTYVNTVKYVIRAEFQIKGVVDKPDIVGAVFGQSEGLLGEELDLRELQKNGRIGRIEITPKRGMGKTTGEITIPSSMDMVETSILAAAIETVDKVGPCEAEFKVNAIEDTRSLKRKELKERAVLLLRRMKTTQIPDPTELSEEVREAARTANIGTYGRDRLPAGPGIQAAEEIIVVEGRADVVNLLRHGFKEVIGMGGSKIPPTLVELTKKKKTIVFIDGDRGGLLNLRKLKSLGKIDFVARAPDGKEVEELVRKEVILALRKKVPLAEFPLRDERPSLRSPVRSFEKTDSRPAPRPMTVRTESTNTSSERTDSRTYTRRPMRTNSRDSRTRPSRPPMRGRPMRMEPREEKVIHATEEETARFAPSMKELKGSLKARLLDTKGKVLDEFSVRELLKKLGGKKNVDSVVFDGIITKRVVDEAKKHKIKNVIGVKKGKFPEDKEIRVLTISA